MKIACFVFIFLLGNTASAQPENDAIKKCISAFFDGMKNNDTLTIRNSLDFSCFLYSIMQTKDGKTIVEEESISAFFDEVVKLKGNKADEQILSYDIKIDGAMGIAWAPYKFYFNDQFSHCGVNVFTLVKRDTVWKIMGITDTRRKKACD